MNIIVKVIKDYIIEIEGSYPYALNQIFELNNKQIGLVIFAKENKAWLMLDGNNQKVNINETAMEKKDGLKIITQEKYFGSVTNIYGEFIHENSAYSQSTKIYPNVSTPFAEAKNMMYRTNLDQPLRTGIYVIDLLFPIGYGQRQVILGDTQTGKTSIALNTIINQAHNPNLKVIYGSIGNKSTDLKHMYNKLKKHNALANCMLLHANADNSMQQYLLPYIAMNHAENLCAAGFDVLVILDNLTNHSYIIREMALLTNTPVGKEAQPGSLFFAHSSLLERAGKFSNNKSITCFPIVKTVNDDANSLLASNIISITDGQIILGSKLKNAGQLPAVDIQLSVSRLGSNVQYPGFRQISSQINHIYSLYMKNIKFSHLDLEFSDYINKVIQQGKLLMQIAKQPEFSCYPDSFNVILSLIILTNLMPNDQQMNDKIRFLNLYMEHEYTGQLLHQKIEEQINQKLEIDIPTLQSLLKDALDCYELTKLPMEKIYFNGPEMKISPAGMQKIKELLWPK